MTQTCVCDKIIRSKNEDGDSSFREKPKRVGGGVSPMFEMNVKITPELRGEIIVAFAGAQPL